MLGCERYSIVSDEVDGLVLVVNSVVLLVKVEINGDGGGSFWSQA